MAHPLGQDPVVLRLTSRDLALEGPGSVGQPLILRSQRASRLPPAITGPPPIERLPPPATVLGDGEALRQLVFILIDNAIKYNTESGSVRVTLRRANGQVVCAVSDSGIGISKEDQQHIFDRFWRADKVRSRGAGGAGLGLSIARWIVESREGIIEVTSEIGVGATFTVTLPAVRVSPQEA